MPVTEHDDDAVVVSVCFAEESEEVGCSGSGGGRQRLKKHTRSRRNNECPKWCNIIIIISNSNSGRNNYERAPEELWQRQ